MPQARYPGFTLAELLISLAILGIIATFTIPKLLMNQRVSAYNASAKESAASISELTRSIGPVAWLVPIPMRLN